jgi:hypothetical protein
VDHLPGHLVKNIWFYLCGPYAPFIYPDGTAGVIEGSIGTNSLHQKNELLGPFVCCFLHSIVNVFVLVP